MQTYYEKTIETPVGTLTLVGSDRGLRAVLWENELDGRVALPETVEGTHPVLEQASTELAEYFAGTRTVFAVPLDMAGTPFQVNAWRALTQIPYGETISYGEQASRLGNPKASRAVGAANGRNPISIVVPCHRVIGSTGSLTGFAAGVSAKKYLLDLERDVARGQLALTL